MKVLRIAVRRLVRTTLLLAMASQFVGCNVDSWFDPSVTGYWETTPTTIPILERIDAIEPKDDLLARATEVSPQDLLPNDLSYRLSAGDYLTVAVLDLFAPNIWERRTVPIDAGGFIRAPQIGDIRAAGMTPQELQEVLVEKFRARIADPQVEVVVEEGRAFQYTVFGIVPAPGVYTLRDPNFRLIDALAAAGGATPPILKYVYVIRDVGLSEQVEAFPDRGPSTTPSGGPGSREPVDIESIIDQLEDMPSPGAFRQDEGVDIDELQPARPGEPPAVDIDRVSPGSPSGRPGSWVFVEERGEWVRVPDSGAGAATATPEASEPALYAERIIRIPLERLSRGESKYNIVIRPKDRIYVEPPESGVVYIDGQILRPGVYTLPVNGDLTLSRLVAAAGGLGQLAIPDRVDLVRRVGEYREAVVRLNLGAIRNRVEPDVLLRGDDHIIIGTNFWAQPLAVIRNGFRVTYGFGFLLDRNFGNDVFGPPPVTITGR